MARAIRACPRTVWPSARSRSNGLTRPSPSRRVTRESSNYFASSVTGSGIHAERIAQLIWLAQISGEKDIARFVWTTLSKAGHRMVKDGKTLTTEEENLVGIRLSVSRFEEQTKPIWQNLGIPVGAPALAVPKEQRLRSA